MESRYEVIKRIHIIIRVASLARTEFKRSSEPKLFSTKSSKMNRIEKN